MQLSSVQQEVPGDNFDLFEKPPHVTRIKLRTSEFVCICPLDNRSDFYKIEVEYQPDGQCITGESFNRYLRTFEGKPYFSEQLGSMIVAKIVSAIRPVYCRATLIQGIREGVQLTTIAEIGRPVDGIVPCDASSEYE